MRYHGMVIRPPSETDTVDEHSDIMEWADRRAKALTVPELTRRDWGIRTDRLKKVVAVESGRKAR